MTALFESRQDHAEHAAALARAVAGDPAGFEDMYRWLAPQVLGFCRARRAADPEAATSEVFVSAFRALSTFEGDPAQFRAWVFRIARNQLIDCGRWSARQPILSSLDARSASEHLVGISASAEDEAIAGVQELEAHILALTAEQAEVIHLRFVVQLSIAETADATGRNVGTVKSLQHRAPAFAREIPGCPYPRARRRRWR